MTKTTKHRCRFRRHDDPDPNPPMTVAEFDEHMVYLGITDGDLARTIEVVPRTIRRWRVGEQPVPGPVRSVLRSWRLLYNAGQPIPDLKMMPLHGGFTPDNLKALGLPAMIIK